MKSSSKLTFEDWPSWVRGWEGDSVLSHILQKKGKLNKNQKMQNVLSFFSTS